MFIIRTFAELSDTIAVLAPDPIHALLQAHMDRLGEYADYDLPELAMFLVVQPEDTLEAIEAEIGHTLIDTASVFFQPPEIIEQHTDWMEFAFILSDDGFGLVLLVPKDSKIDPKLRQACINTL